MWTYTHGAITENVNWTITGEDTASDIAKNWVGVLFAVQAVGSVMWAMVIPRFKSLKASYIISLLLGAAGFISTLFIHDQYVLLITIIIVDSA